VFLSSTFKACSPLSQPCRHFPSPQVNSSIHQPSRQSPLLSSLSVPPVRSLLVHLSHPPTFPVAPFESVSRPPHPFPPAPPTFLFFCW
jgi:hypothetical protein